jgi:hypothetical protein
MAHLALAFTPLVSSRFRGAIEIATTLTALAGMPGLAGCSSDDTNPGGLPGTGGVSVTGGASAQGGSLTATGGVTSPGAGGGPSGAGGAGGVDPVAGGMPGAGGAFSGGGSGAGAITASGGALTGSGGATAAGGEPGDAAPPDDGLSDAKLLVPDPSWTCGMPAGIPGTKGGKQVLDVAFQMGSVHDFGKTQYGQRQLVEVAGGTMRGPDIEGTVASRGLDLTLTLSNGALEVEQVNILQASDGALIYFRTCGAAPRASADVRVVGDFEAPSSGPYAFLNKGRYVGVRTLDVAAKTLHLVMYDMTGVALPAGSVKLVDPPGERQQTWDCRKAPGSRTSVVYTESVGIGAGSLSVGASKRGTRNIIPITGGTTSGRVKGKVLSSGADYQLLGSAFELDARYTIETDDGALILVRNCGPVGALVPVFETRADGPYSWLDEDRWVSSDPGITPGAVNLTIYDTR